MWSLTWPSVKRKSWMFGILQSIISFANHSLILPSRNPSDGLPWLGSPSVCAAPGTLSLVKSEAVRTVDRLCCQQQSKQDEPGWLLIWITGDLPSRKLMKALKMWTAERDEDCVLIIESTSEQAVKREGAGRSKACWMLALLPNSHSQLTPDYLWEAAACDWDSLSQQWPVRVCAAEWFSWVRRPAPAAASEGTPAPGERTGDD